MNYEDLFSRFGSPSSDGEIRISGYLIRPDKLSALENIVHYDLSAARVIEECEAAIEVLKEYRRNLTARYNALATMASRKTIKLERYKNYDNRVIYYIRHITTYEDGTAIETGTEKFAGSQRQNAIKRFEELKKRHPGIEFIKDTAKKSWER